MRFVSGVMTGALMAMAMVAGCIFLLNYNYDAAGPLASARAVSIRAGEGRIEIAQKLEDAGVVRSRQLFVINHVGRNFVRWFRGQSWRALKAGEYEFATAASMRSVLETISKGRIVHYKVTVPEGLTSQQIVTRVMKNADLVGDVAQVPAEGTLLPETYEFTKGSKRQDIIKRMQEDRVRAVGKLWEKRAPDLPFATMEEAVILASIVEKETGVGSERAHVASVFLNRMRKGMRLQSDPTIIYGIVGGQGSLRRPIYRTDIKKKTPYNTYQIKGLPPGPICNPGSAAIAAVLNPMQSDDLYFVADGTGGHTFSKTLKEHNEAVASWRKIEKAARAKAKVAAAAAATVVAGDAATGIPVAGQGAGAGAGALKVASPAGGNEVATAVNVAPNETSSVEVDARPEGAAASVNGVAVPLPVRKPK